MANLTLDSGVLIALERRDRAVAVHLAEALTRGASLTVPTAVLAEVWRGGRRSARLASFLPSCKVHGLDEPFARRVGEARARVGHATLVDTIVMASASLRGDHVLTGDVDDLTKLTVEFPNVSLIPL